MRCFLFSLSKKKFGEHQWVWRERPGEEPEPGSVDEALRALEGRAGKRRTTADAWKARVKRGNETTYLPERRETRDKEGPINPTPETLKAIKTELQKIYDRVFPRRYASKFSGEVTDKYIHILRDIPEGILLQAITENGSEKELLKRFEAELTILRDKAESSNIPTETWNFIKDFFRWLTDNKVWGLEGENPNVQNRGPIKPRHKTAMGNELKKLEDYYKKRLEDKHGRWYWWDGYDDNQVEFLEEVELPFYRELYMNRTIVEGNSVLDFATDYSEFLKTAFRECITDAEDRAEQLQDDLQETGERTKKDAWLRPIQAMIEHTKY